MKIIGGHYGVSGSAWISRDNKLVVEGAQRAVYSPTDISSVTASIAKEKRFGVFGFIIGALVLSVILGFLFNILGVIIALVIAIAGSFYSEKTNIVEVLFSDSRAVTLECTPRGVKKLVRFAPSR